MLTGAHAPYTVAAQTLAAVKAGLTDVPAVAYVANGLTAWDSCEVCGQLTVGPLRMFLSDEFPIEAVKTQSNSPASWLCVEYGVQIIRCAPGPTEQGHAPSAAQIDASAQQVFDDAWETMTAVWCALEAMLANDIIDFMVRDQVFVGPEGQCVGSELHFTVALHRA